MATITTYQNENSIILGNREAYCRPFDAGSWTEIRIGMLFRMVGNANDTASYVNETVTIASPTDKVYFGIKTSGSNMPGSSGVDFIGAGTLNSSTVGGQNVGYSYVFNAFTQYTLYITAISGSSTYTAFSNQVNANGFTYPSSPFTTNYDGFYGLKFTLLNSGSVSQSLALSYKRNTDNNGSGSLDLHLALVSDTNWNQFPTSTTASWVPGTPLPDAFFAYTPFYTNRLRMSALEVVKIS